MKKHSCSCTNCGSTLHHKYMLFCFWVKQSIGCMNEICINHYEIPSFYSLETRRLWVKNILLSKDLLK